MEQKGFLGGGKGASRFAAAFLAAGALWAFGAPPLSLEGYLDEKLPEAPAERKPGEALNQACFVCHGNLREEPLVKTHAQGRVGCAECHGPSLAHRNDEDNTTPPDRMFFGARIDALCKKCHPRHDVSARRVVRRFFERRLAGRAPQVPACTDCHFQHRLSVRTVRWDKRTGKLLMESSRGPGSPKEGGK